MTDTPRPRRLRRVFLGVLAALFAVVAIALLSAWEPDRPVSTLTARWAPPPSTFVAVRGMQVHLRDEGPRDDPSPIVLLHGTSASLHTWDGWVAALRGTRRVVRFDLPGFGLTGPAPDGVYTMDAYAAFVTAVLDERKISRFVLAGNSFGGNVALAVTLAHPDRVEKLILVDSAGYPPEAQSIPIGFQLARMPVVRHLVAKLLPRRVVTSSVKSVYGDPSKVTPELVDRYYELTLREGNRKALPERFEQAPSGSLAPRIGEIRAPTLVLWGGRDRLIPPTHAARFAKDVPGAKVVVFDALGHVPHEEDAEATVAAVQAFLR